MKGRPLGRSGITVPEIGLGMGRIPAKRNGGPDPQEAVEIIRRAYFLGFTLFDTSPVYSRGESETVLGRALQEMCRDKVTVVTKFGLWADGRSDFTATGVRRSLEESLGRLRTDYVDVYLVHGPSYPDQCHELAACLAEMQRYRSAGVIKSLGVSLGPGTPEEFRWLLQTGGCDVVELRHNIMSQNLRAVLQENHETSKVGILVKSPLESGWLAGRDVFDTSRQRRWDAAEIDRRHRLRDAIREILPPDTDLLSAALMFVLNEPSVSAVLCGAKSIEQLERLARVLPEALTEEIQAGLVALGASPLAQSEVW
jgi:aryl-alcohol dehydrogenase-like predicted oxidoreductase